MSAIEFTAAESPIDSVRGTAERLPSEFARLIALETLLLDRFARAGYEPLRTPVLEYTELHERKSGAGIVSRLFEIAGASVGNGRVCLRPELTAGMVRAYIASEVPPELPWRVSHSGPVFRYETPKPGRLREFQQIGVERLGDSGAVADAEIIWLADWALSEAGVVGTKIRIGHVGLILEMLERSGLPGPLGAALIERLSEAASDGEGVQALESGLEQLSGWLQAGEATEVPDEVDRVDDPAIDRLFRTLVPVVTGRRSGAEIVHRLRRKWDLGHGLIAVLDRVRKQVHGLAGLKGSPAKVLERFESENESLAPDSIAAIRQLLGALEAFGVDPGRIELDLGFGRGIGFYSRMICEISAQTAEGRVELCGGGRYDGLARVLGSTRDDRGVGFAFGLERLDAVLEAQGRGPLVVPPSGFLILAETLNEQAIALASRLRLSGSKTILETGLSLENALGRAETLGLSRLVQVMPDSLVLHDLIAMNQTRVDLKQLLEIAEGETASSSKGRPS